MPMTNVKAVSVRMAAVKSVGPTWIAETVTSAYSTAAQIVEVTTIVLMAISASVIYANHPLPVIPVLTHSCTRLGPSFAATQAFMKI
jgi:hypothetical protein